MRNLRDAVGSDFAYHPPPAVAQHLHDKRRIAAVDLLDEMNANAGVLVSGEPDFLSLILFFVVITTNLFSFQEHLLLLIILHLELNYFWHDRCTMSEALIIGGVVIESMMDVCSESRKRT